jgi:ankyrin repeat protein
MNPFLIVQRYDLESLMKLDIKALNCLDEMGRNLLYPLFSLEKVAIKLSNLSNDELIFDYLISNGVDINHVDQFGNSNVMYCAMQNNTSLLKKIMHLNPNFSIQNADGKTFFDFISVNNLKCIGLKNGK